MSIIVEYRNSLPSCQYVFKNGSSAYFLNHIYRTSDPKEIEELNAEIKAKHPNISGGKELTADDLDPMSGLKARIAAEAIEAYKRELVAKHDAAIDPNNDMGGTPFNAKSFGASNSNDTLLILDEKARAAQPKKVTPTDKVAGIVTKLDEETKPAKIAGVPVVEVTSKGK